MAVRFSRTLCMLSVIAGSFVCMTLPASACKYVGYRNGEPHCITTTAEVSRTRMDERGEFISET